MPKNPWPTAEELDQQHQELKTAIELSREREGRQHLTAEDMRVTGRTGGGYQTDGDTVLAQAKAAQAIVAMFFGLVAMAFAGTFIGCGIQNTTYDEKREADRKAALEYDERSKPKCSCGFLDYLAYTVNVRTEAGRTGEWEIKTWNRDRFCSDEYLAKELTFYLVDYEDIHVMVEKMPSRSGDVWKIDEQHYITGGDIPGIKCTKVFAKVVNDERLKAASDEHRLERAKYIATMSRCSIHGAPFKDWVSLTGADKILDREEKVVATSADKVVAHRIVAEDPDGKSHDVTQIYQGPGSVGFHKDGDGNWVPYLHCGSGHYSGGRE